MSDLINTILWGGPTPGLSACSKPSQPAKEQEIVIDREEFGGSWKPTEVDECERDHVLNNVYDASKTLSAKNFAKLYSLWANVARKVFGRDQFKKPFEGLSPYQQDYAVAMLADRLSILFWGKQLSHIMSWSRHWFGCKTDELWGYIFPPQVNLGFTPSDVTSILNAAKIEAEVMVDELEMPKGGKPGEIKITLIPASFKSRNDPLVSPTKSVPFDMYADLPSEEAKEGKYLIDLGPGIRAYLKDLPSRDAARNIEITVQFTIDEDIAIICGSAIKQRDMVVLYKPKHAEEPYKIATIENALTKKPVKKPVTPPPPPPPTPPGKEDCENSGGTWMTVANKCNCPPGMKLKEEKCVTAKISPSPDKKKPKYSKITPTSGKQGSKPPFKITGKRIPAGARVDFGPGTSVLNKKVSNTKITGKLSIASNATKGARYIIINGKKTKLVFTVTKAPPTKKEKCEKSGGTWKKNKCECPSPKELKHDKCVKKELPTCPDTPAGKTLKKMGKCK